MSRKLEKAEASAARAATMDRFAQVFQKLYEPVDTSGNAAIGEIATPANAQPSEYPDTWFSKAARRIRNSPAVCVLAHLSIVIPVGGGTLRTAAFSRLTGMYPARVREAIEKLTELGAIDCERHGQDELWIRVSCRDNYKTQTATPLAN